MADYALLAEYNRAPIAEIAQSVEQLIRNQQVGGSIPLLGTICE